MRRGFTVRIFLGLLVLAASAVGVAATDVDIGGMVVSVSDSFTAQVFHVVDQLSEWDEASHRQYGRWAARTLNFNEEDRALLRKHAELRSVRGWENGFEQAFYVDESIEVAADDAVERKLLSREEAAAEKAILLHFAPKLSRLRDEGAPLLASFRRRLAAELKKIAPFVEKLIHFSETRQVVRVPLFLIPNPEEGNAGGGFNGGRLVLEVQDQPDPLPILFHECLHALLFPHKAAIEAAAKTAGLKFGALNEGIAYALAPGLTDNIEDADSLAEALVKNVLRGTLASDSYVQAYAVALVIRPLLRAALERGETLTVFLPKAVEKWRTRSR